MKKDEFLNELRKRLQGLPKDEIDERVSFYDEMIEDMVDDGKTEEEAVESFGSIDDVVLSIADKTKLRSLVKERVTPKRKITAFEIVLLCLGFPLWFPLLLVFLVLLLIAYLLLWIFVLVTHTIEFAFVSYSLSGFVASALLFNDGKFNYGYVGISTLVLGLACLFIPVCYYATKFNIRFTKKIFLGIKNSLIGGKKNA